MVQRKNKYDNLDNTSELLSPRYCCHAFLFILFDSCIFVFSVMSSILSLT